MVGLNILKSTDSITATLTIAVDTSSANKKDHDIIIGISNGESFIGFEIHDKYNYNTISPCYKLEGRVVKDKLQNTIHGTGSLVASRKFSSEVKIQIKSIDKWGSCHTEHDEGYVNIQNYKHSLNLTKALNFEVYRQNARERYRIKYIRVDVELN